MITLLKIFDTIVVSGCVFAFVIVILMLLVALVKDVFEQFFGGQK